ncbi:unnamed protein product [Adineta ricciae]|uniref:Uncharacterized protein n=1 Tax=Adineta ricciae TaxID=249248 RepID=A0A814M4I5_ADIRI|nr:unnamed protein product [Adineta ricciae]CAF1073084.1 unnamed protein product [Adineta ricciae]
MTLGADEIQLEKQWQTMFPSIISGLFAFYEILCSIGVVGCELGSVLIDKYNCTIYVGFWSGLFLISAWISQVLAVSRCLTRRCATETLILKCISLVFAVCIISFDTYFVITPTACFYSSSLCNSNGTSRGVFYSKTNFNQVKIPLIKAQLAIAAAMFAFDVAYIVMYAVTWKRLKKYERSEAKVSNKSKPMFIDDHRYVVESLPTTDGNVINENESTKVTDLDVVDVHENVTESFPPSTTNHTTKNILVKEATFVVTNAEEMTKLAMPSTIHSVNRTVIITRQTHIGTANKDSNKSSLSASSITANTVSTNAVHHFIREKSTTNVVLPSTTSINALTDNRIDEHTISTISAKTHAWDIDENTGKSLLPTKTTYYDTVNPNESVIKSSRNSISVTHSLSLSDNTESVPPRKNTPIHVWDADTSVVKSLSETNTGINTSLWMDKTTTNPTTSQPIDRDMWTTDEKIAESLPSFSGTNIAAVQTSFIEFPHRSRWSVTSADFL